MTGGSGSAQTCLTPPCQKPSDPLPADSVACPAVFGCCPFSPATPRLAQFPGSGTVSFTSSWIGVGPYISYHAPDCTTNSDSSAPNSYPGPVTWQSSSSSWTNFAPNPGSGCTTLSAAAVPVPTDIKENCHVSWWVGRGQGWAVGGTGWEGEEGGAGLEGQAAKASTIQWRLTPCPVLSFSLQPV
jgi:hypothetical protein